MAMGKAMMEIIYTILAMTKTAYKFEKGTDLGLTVVPDFSVK